MIISTIHDPANLEAFKKAGADALIVSMPDFSIRNEDELSISKIKEFSKEVHAKEMLLYVNMMAFLHESKKEKLIEVLEEIKYDIDGIYYGDEGILEACRKLNIEDKLIYQPETLVTNSMDANFYLNQNIQAVSLAHELSLEEINAIAKKADSLEVQIHGYYSILYSRRPLVENYLRAIGSDRKNKPYEIIEQTRNERMKIVQNVKGTIVYSDKPKMSFKQILKLKEAGIDRFRIEGIFLSDKEIVQLISLYKQALEGVLPENVDGDDSWYYKESLLRKE